MGPLRRSLEQEWEATAVRPEASRALRRWASSEPVLAPFLSLPAVLEAVNRRGASRSANDVLAALLRVAEEEPLARRCVLQALVPALLSLARRYPGEGDHEDRFQEALTLSIERIADLAGRDVAWPSTAVVGHVRDRLRREVRGHRMQRLALEDIPDLAAGPERSAAERLAGVVVDGYRHGSLRREEAALLYATRVVGFPSARVAATLGLDADVVRSRRNRAEARLIDSHRAVC